MSEGLAWWSVAEFLLLDIFKFCVVIEVIGKKADGLSFLLRRWFLEAKTGPVH